MPDCLSYGSRATICQKSSSRFSGLAISHSQITRGRHPLRLLVAIDWLFRDCEEFIAMHVGPPSQVDVEAQIATGSGAPTHAAEDPRKARLLDMLAAGESATAAARSIGIDVATAMAWAAAQGVVVGRRPKVLTQEVRQSLIRDLQAGLDKLDAAGRHGVSVETVTRVLRTEIGLRAAWTAARTSHVRKAARGSWLALAQQPLGVKLMRASNPAAYAWLYRNDRQWLREHTPSGRTGAPEARSSSVRWDERDEALSLAVRRALVQLSEQRPAVRLRLWQIYQAVPELKPKLGSLDRLPLTRRVLESALERSVTSAGASLLD